MKLINLYNHKKNVKNFWCKMIKNCNKKEAVKMVRKDKIRSIKKRYKENQEMVKKKGIKKMVRSRNNW